LLVFVVDYWHMKNNVKADQGSTPGFRVSDVVISMVFLFSYYTFSKALTKKMTKRCQKYTKIVGSSLFSVE